MSLLAYGDPHGVFKPLKTAVQDHAPDAVVLLGDYDLTQPLQAVLNWAAPGVPTRWVHGNHDVDTEAFYDHLYGSDPSESLHATRANLGGFWVGGLGGVFRTSLWDGESTPRFKSRAKMLASTRREDRWRDGLPLRDRATIFQEDFDRVASMRLDVLVTHEAPSCHRYGWKAIDRLAAACRAKLIVHGHQHETYDAYLPGGIQVRGLGLHEAWPVTIY